MSTDDITAEDRVSALRGAGVTEFDRRRLVQAALVLLAGVLLLASVALFVTGARKNSQIEDLRHHGVDVTVTVTNCQGLIGGSGSNGAGYACSGTFTLDGRHFNEGIPGNALLAPRTKIRAIAVPGDAGLMTTPAILAGEHSSGGVFVLPSVLVALAAVTLVALVLSFRRAKPESDEAIGD